MPENQDQQQSSADQTESIRRRALELARARGQREGYTDEDWRLAESEVTGITGGG